MSKKDLIRPMIEHVQQKMNQNDSSEEPIQEKKFNKLLARQIRRKLGKDTPLTDEMMELLSAVSDSYDHFEKDRAIIERSVELSSKELRESYGKLAIQNELKRTNIELQQFVSIASHDLKAPLRTINSFVQLLERKLKEHLDDNTKEYMEFIKSGVQGMDELIQNLLQHAKASSNKGKIEPINIEDILSIIKRNLHALMQESDAQIFVEDKLPVVNAVSFQMIQLFQNIIGNGIKFKRQDVNPIIRIKCKEENNQYCFSIIDNGIGIDPKNADKVFEVFQRLQGANKYEGTGLGLSICKKIVENLKGKIWLESEVGVGTTFFFSIPKETQLNDEQQILVQKIFN